MIQISYAFESRQLFDVDEVPNRQFRHVDFDKIRDILRQTTNRDFVSHCFQSAAIVLHAGRLSTRMNRNIEDDHFVIGDLTEIDMDIGVLDRMTLYFLNNRSAGHDAGESVSPQSVSGFAFSESEKIQIQVAPPESAPALNARLAALTESNADLKQQVIHAAKTSAKLWNLIDALRVENEQTKSLVRRETCDVEKLAPICAALNDEPQTNIPTRVRQRTSDLRLRRLWGTPADDPSPKHPRELLVVTVGEKMMANVNKVVLRFDPVDSRLGFGFGVE